MHIHWKERLRPPCVSPAAATHRKRVRGGARRVLRTVHGCREIGLLSIAAGLPTPHRAPAECVLRGLPGNQGTSTWYPHTYLFEEGVGLEADFRSFFRLKSVTKLIGTF